MLMINSSVENASTNGIFKLIRVVRSPQTIKAYAGPTHMPAYDSTISINVMSDFLNDRSIFSEHIRLYSDFSWLSLYTYSPPANANLFTLKRSFVIQTPYDATLQPSQNGKMVTKMLRKVKFVSENHMKIDLPRYIHLKCIPDLARY